jgi:nicotinamidase/pyrazinamidase
LDSATHRHAVVFVDVDTQADFMLPGGRLYVPGAEKLIPTLARLRDFAEQHEIPIITSTDAHATDDPEFQQWPAHCVRMTPGQLKIPESLVRRYMVVPQERQTRVSEQEIARYQQWILEKDDLDMFTNPHADDLVKRLDGGEYVVYGVATEYCVKCAVKGLLERKRQVTLLVDAIKEIKPEDGRAILDELKAGGAKLARAEEMLGAPLAA